MYVFDFEGTLSDHKWRVANLPSKEEIAKASPEEKQIIFDVFHQCMMMDEPRHNICDLYRVCYKMDYTIILTGVMDRLDHRQQILMWMNHWKLPFEESRLVMRKQNDLHPSPIYKLDVCNQLKRYNPNIFAFDDREDVILALLNNGIPGIVV